MSTLHKRLASLEALAANAPDHLQPARAAFMKAAFDTLSCRREWVRQGDGLVQDLAPAQKLAQRIQTDAMTDDDRALLESWPSCHIHTHRHGESNGRPVRQVMGWCAPSSEASKAGVGAGLAQLAYKRRERKTPLPKR